MKIRKITVLLTLTALIVFNLMSCAKEIPTEESSEISRSPELEELVRPDDKLDSRTEAFERFSESSFYKPVYEVFPWEIEGTSNGSGMWFTDDYIFLTDYYKDNSVDYYSYRWQQDPELQAKYSMPVDEEGNPAVHKCIVNICDYEKIIGETIDLSEYFETYNLCDYALTPDGKLFVLAVEQGLTDFSYKYVCRTIDAEGNVSDKVQIEMDDFLLVNTICIDSEGDIYFLCWDDNLIPSLYKFDKNGKLIVE